MLGVLFAWKQDEWQTDLKEFGCYMGKFIYIMDAYEDIGDDVKRNHIIHLYSSCIAAIMIRKNLTNPVGL